MRARFCGRTAVVARHVPRPDVAIIVVISLFVSPQPSHSCALQVHPSLSYLSTETSLLYTVDVARNITDMILKLIFVCFGVF